MSATLARVAGQRKAAAELAELALAETRAWEDDGEWYDDLTECGGCEGSGRVTEADAELFYALMMEEAV